MSLFSFICSSWYWLLLTSFLFVCFTWHLGRYLRFMGYQVNYVRNFTDVDDKVNQLSLLYLYDICFLIKAYSLLQIRLVWYQIQSVIVVYKNITIINLIYILLVYQHMCYLNFTVLMLLDPVVLWSSSHGTKVHSLVSGFWNPN